MTKENQISTIVAACIVISGLTVAWYFISGFFFKPEEASCGQVASNVYQMNVHASDGQLLTPIGLQSDLGLNSLGVIEHSRVVNTGASSPKIALEVSLPENAGAPYGSSNKKGGVAFKWSHIDLSSASKACVRYAVKLPKGFKPGNGGMLPGLFAGNLPIEDESDGKAGFAIHTMWDKSGELALYAQIPATKLSNRAILNREKIKIDTGRWVWIDQQVTLNAPNQNNGEYKLWVDGKIAYEHKQVAWRSSEDLKLKGVNGTVYYGGPKIVSVAPEATVIAISPFQLSWE